MRIECPCCDYEWDPDEIVDERPLFWVQTKAEFEIVEMLRQSNEWLSEMMSGVYAEGAKDRLFLAGEQWDMVNRQRIHES